MGAQAADAEIYVCDISSIRVFADDATANDSPIRTLQAPTPMGCYGVALDSLHDEVWTGTGNFVSAFRASADGTVAPLRTIGGPASSMGFVSSVAVDVAANELFVGTANGEVFVFPRGADGDAVPLRKISGATTGLADVLSVFVDRVNDELYVANYNGAKVVVFDRTDTGNVPPSRSFPAGANPFGLFVDPRAGEVVVVSGGAFVRTYDLFGAQLRNVSGASTHLDKALGVTLTSAGQLLVSSQSTVSTDPDPILGFPRSTNGEVAPSPWIFNGAVPTRDAWGLTTNRALACGEGNVTSRCLFRDSFARGDTGNWSSTVVGSLEHP